jgi:hypothetical protein
VLCLRPADPVEYVAAYLLKNNTVSRAALNAPHVPLPQLITGAGCYPFCNPYVLLLCVCDLQNNPDSAAPATS